MSGGDYHAEDLPYWKSGCSDPSVWIEKAKAVLERAGADITGEAFGAEPQTGRAAFMLAFDLAGDRFKVTWPVIQSKEGNVGAERRQAATMLYHDVKARAVSSMVLGARVSFLPHLLLPSGATAGQAADRELVRLLPGIARAAELPEATAKMEKRT